MLTCIQPLSADRLPRILKLNPDCSTGLRRCTPSIESPEERHTRGYITALVLMTDVGQLLINLAEVIVEDETFGCA
jgi:hypothetical protein